MLGNDGRRAGRLTGVLLREDQGFTRDSELRADAAQI
jgi:hypothetical protein